MPYKRLSISFVILIIIFGVIYFINFPTAPKYIIILVPDSLRPDHMSCYGYDKLTTPFIDSKVKNGLLFKNAYSSGNWTTPAISSLFTGLYSFQHKTSEVWIPPYVKDNKIISDILPDQLLTLAEVLKEYGYQNYCLYNNYSIHSAFGFDQGFDNYIDINDMLIVKTFINIFNHHPGKKFFYIHFTSPHSPYTELDNSIAREFENINSNILSKYPFKKRVILPTKNQPYGKTNKNLGDFLLGYDKEIYWIDRQFKQIWEFLENKDALDDSLIILLADHGEQFMEHGKMGHVDGNLWEEVIHIPL
ncbi:sulfatase, partial [Elusimicrobiota bacterium]